RFKYVDHPPYSPDLNPIENCWAYLRKQIWKLPKRATNDKQLFEVAQKLWKEMPQEVLDNSIDSMMKRLKDVRRNNGGSTNY
ncbi:hypothetical protein TREMEDRAFT_35730, partial [Tremella mesenterica DSM 1558]|uniref:uncharacterized protein n=1 Tax=Tremella mesenterica (strain ATCC 24925 / CBS 8224 / DSM 1558 / NBRC 9311 / NRRL Y-6157 / RJB 2259-6 / UBC 559-6) TaxID=578456 RepID=UPI00032BEC96